MIFSVTLVQDFFGKESKAVCTTRAANNKQQQRPIQSMKTTARNRAGLLAGPTLALLISVSGTLDAKIHVDLNI